MNTQDHKETRLLALANPDAKLNVIVVYNPLDVTDRTVAQVDWANDVALAKYLEDLPENVDWSVSLNGEILDRDKWEVIYPQPEDSLVLMPVPHGGGGGGKSILRIVALLAIAVLAAYTGGLAAAAYGSIVGGIVTATITVAGGILVNALLPPPKPPSSNVSGPNNSSEGLTFGIDGPKNTSAETTPIPIVYGTHRVAGNIIDQRVDNITGTQTLYVRSVVSEGPIDSIDASSLQIQQQRRTDFNNVSFSFRLGTDNQTVAPSFNQTDRQVNKATKITTNFLNYTTETQVEGIRLDLVWPSGLVNIDLQGNRQAASVQLVAQYSVTGANTWHTFTDPSGRNFLVTAAQRSALRLSYVTPALTKGIYDIRIKRTTVESASDTLADSVFLADVSELINEPVQYNFTAWFAIAVTLTDQLNQVPNVTVQVRGRTLDHYDDKGTLLGNFWDDNPAWVALDLLMHPRYGGALVLSRIDIAKWVQWANFCTAQGLRFNGVFDTEGNLWDALMTVMRIGHANIVMIGTRYSVAIEMADVPTQMFSIANIVQDSFQIDWSSLSNRANEVEVQYFDATDFYRQHMVRAIDPIALAQGKPQVLASMTLIGVTDNATAFKEAWFQLQMNRFIQQTVTFDAFVDSIACTVGDLIYVQHDMPQWGFSGRVAAGSTTTVVNLDREMTMESGKNYRLLVLHDALERTTTTASVVIGKSVFISNTVNVSNVKRLKWVRPSDSVVFDAAIIAVNAGSPSNELVLDQNAAGWGLPVGGTVQLWDTDVVEERVVVSQAGSTQQITVTSAFTLAPAQFAKFMFGENLKIKKIFRVKSIRGTHDLYRTITAFEYNESIYSDPIDATPTPNFSDLSSTIDPVQNLEATEDLHLSGTAVRVRVTAAWDRPDIGMYVGADVYVNFNNTGFQQVATIRGNGTSAAFDAQTDDQLQIRVMSVDGAGSHGLLIDAPTISYVVQGNNRPPSDVTGFSVAKVPGGLQFSWNSNPELDVTGYEVREAPWDTGAVIISGYAGNRFTTPKAQSGTHTYAITAINSSGILSLHFPQASLTLAGPATVKNFQAVQNGSNIVFNWTANLEPDIIGYELREGLTWASSQHIATIASTHFMIVNDSPGDRTFWVKAVDSAGLQSDDAVFATPLVATLPNRNVLFTQDEAAGGFSNFKYKMDVSAGDLELVVTSQYGEYVTIADLGGAFFARATLADAFDSVVPDSTTWAAATFTWGSLSSARAWQAQGNSVVLEKLFAREIGLQADQIEGFTFNQTLTGVGGTVPTSAPITPVYQDGRYSQGIRIDASNEVQYAVTVSSQFSLKVGVRVQDFSLTTRLLQLDDGGSNFIQVNYDRATDSFQLRGSDNKIVLVPNSFAVDDRLVIAISQDASTRTLWVGRQDDGAMASSSVSGAPLAAFTVLSL